MAQYEFSSGFLSETQEQLRYLTIGLNTARDRLNVVLMQWHDNLPELRRDLVSVVGRIGNAEDSARKVSQALEEIAEVYAQADKTAFEGGVCQSKPAVTSPVVTPMTVRKPSGAILFGDLVMPDWLRIAVIKYEQSQYNPTEGTKPATGK